VDWIKRISALASAAAATNYGVFVGLNTYNTATSARTVFWTDACGRDACLHERNAARQLDGGQLADSDERAGHAHAHPPGHLELRRGGGVGRHVLYFHSSHGGNDDWPYST
jgi:hypothetical protein